MERHNVGGELFQLVNVYLEEQGLKLNRGTSVDATIIEAPRSTKNETRQRDPDMASVQKGDPWSFGLKAHSGVDRQTKLMHCVVVTSAHVHDSPYWVICFRVMNGVSMVILRIQDKKHTDKSPCKTSERLHS